MLPKGSAYVAVVMPAYNEEALDDFLAEVEAALKPVTRRLHFIIVDDASTDELPIGRLDVLPLGSTVHLIRNETNLGHGPSALRAYEAGLRTSPDLVIHVDGDGQFLGHDFVSLLEAVTDFDGVVGARAGRKEPWFRRAMTIGARLMVGGGLVGADVNSPLRIYRIGALRRLLEEVRADSAVPHLHFAVLHARLGLDIREINVTHRPRRGATEVGNDLGSPTAGRRHYPLAG